MAKIQVSTNDGCVVETICDFEMYDLFDHAALDELIEHLKDAQHKVMMDEGVI